MNAEGSSSGDERTLLFTDVEASTALLAHIGADAYAQALAQQRRIVRAAVASHAGTEVDTAGDSFFVVFPDAAGAVAAAVDAQVGLASVEWPAGTRPRVRMGLHTGPVQTFADGYVGISVHQASRIASAAHGDQVIASASTRAAAGDEWTWRSLGTHRLKDLAAPHELFQVLHAKLVAEFPALRSLERVRHNLPVQPSTFHGRAEELRVGAKLLATTRLLTLTGTGGTGKTRLAYQLAAEHLDEHLDGVWVAELASVAEPSLVPTALMIGLGLRDEPGRTATETLIAHLRGRSALVVLDNCEHVVAAAAALADALVRNCTEVRVVATTREPLRVSGEVVWLLEPMPVPESTDDYDAVATCDAVTLFRERAVQSDPAFRLSRDNIDAVVRICRRVDGIPLAIELAAARVATMPLRRIADRLDRDLAHLAERDRGAAGRHASLRAAVAWSYDLLDASERQLFGRIGVFVGGLTVDAAEAVCADTDADDVADALDGLAEKSLVRFVPDATGDGRYRLLETIRVFAAEVLQESADSSQVADRHAAHYAALARDLSDVGRQPRNVPRLSAEHPNLLAALERLAHAPQENVHHGRLVTDLVDFWEVRGDWRLAREALRRYLARSDRDPLLAGACAAALGRIEVDLCNYDAAQAALDESLAVSRAHADTATECVALIGTGAVAQNRGDHERAIASFGAAIAIARSSGDGLAEARALRLLALTAQNRGRLDEATERYQQSLSLARELGDQRLEMTVLSNLGTAYGMAGNFAASRGHLEDAHAQAPRDR